VDVNPFLCDPFLCDRKIKLEAALSRSGSDYDHEEQEEKEEEEEEAEDPPSSDFGVARGAAQLLNSNASSDGRAWPVKSNRVVLSTTFGWPSSQPRPGTQMNTGSQ